MSNKRDKLTRNILIDSLSEDHVRVIESLSKPRYDEDIAEELKIKATIVRTMLNDLHSASLVDYDRSKNKKTGWYTYVWNRRDDKVDEYIHNYLQAELVKLTSELENEKQGIKFSCRCAILPFENALESDFICNECGDQLLAHDNSEKIDELVGNISTLNSLLAQSPKKDE